MNDTRQQINGLLAAAIDLDEDEAVKAMLVALFTLDILRNATTTIELRRKPGEDELAHLQADLSRQVGLFLQAEGYIRWKQEEFEDRHYLHATATLLRKPK